MSSSPRGAIAIIGAGPRGASLIERVGANLADPAFAAEAGLGGGLGGAGLGDGILSGGGAAGSAGVGLDLHVVDDAPSGAGHIWRPDQERELCMNTLADAVTLFTEPSSTVAGPVRPGPTFFEWCRLALREARAPESAEVPADRAAAFFAHPPRPGLVDAYRGELERMRPDSHPSRALYGEYLAWCYARAVAALPPGVRLIRHRSRAIDVERVDARPGSESGRAGDGASAPSRERVRLSDGTAFEADTVVLATGWLPRAQTPAEHELESRLAERPDLAWVRPGSPADQDLAGIAPGADVIVRGLGMGFFDTMALLTLGRGGSFEAHPDDPSRLRYRASGREPVLHATSRSGVPFRAKTLYGSLPPAPEQRLAREVDWAAVPRPIDFDRLLWPRIVGDAYIDYSTALYRSRPSAFTAPIEQIVETIAAEARSLTGSARPADPSRAHEGEAAPAGAGRSDDPGAVAGPSGSPGGGPGGSPGGGCSPRSGSDLDLDLDTDPVGAAVARIDAAAAAHLRDPADRFDLAAELHPVDGVFDSPAAFESWMRERVRRDLAEAGLGRDSAFKAGLWSISAARGLAGRLGSRGGFDAESRQSGFAALHAIGGRAGSGPPAFRTRQLLALMDAGIVRFIGPDARVGVDERGFTAESPQIAGSAVTAPALIDAWMHFHSVAESADPLVRSLVAAGRARPFHVQSRAGERVATGGFDIDAGTGLLIGADGVRDAAVHVAGIPLDETLHGTIISPMPGTDPPMLRETDRTARSALRIAARAALTALATGEAGAAGAAPPASPGRNPAPAVSDLPPASAPAPALDHRVPSPSPIGAVTHDR